LGVQELHPAIATAFTYLTFLVIINAFNLIDGVDGLAGMLGLISTLFFGVVFTLENQTAYAILAFSTAGSLVAFLMFNISPARIFMGDTGSLLLGLVNAVLVVHFINFETSASAVLKFPAAPALGFAVLFLPLMDTLRVTLIRIYRGRSPFDPDVNHLHHILLRKGFSHIKITGMLSLAAVGFILVAYMLLPLGITFAIFSIVILATLLMAVMTYSGNNGGRYPGNQSISKSETSRLSRFFTRVSATDSEINN
jgi:UDP-N-acetylmuramyl pentapeptide phosphotransferase/UDP-N-acetylglucosamine-1-phosphate transferase